MQSKSYPPLNNNSFVKSNPYLTVDTSLFPPAFQAELLSELSLADDPTLSKGLDAATDGLLIHADNFQALQLLQTRYREQVKCIYIDPPYNTKDDRAKGRFLYKDNYPHSSWLSLINDRIVLGKQFLNSSGIFAASIDDSENYRLREVLNSHFGEDNYLYEVVWNLGTGTQAGHFTRSHEYIHFYAINKNLLPNFATAKGGIIQDRAVKKISKDNPASKITFPAGIRFEGKNATFEGTIGGSEKQMIHGTMIFADGKLQQPVTIEAGWAMKNQVLSWLDGKETFDTKGQRVKEFYFNNKGILWYIKERGTEHPATVLSNIANTKTGSSELKNIIAPLDIPFSFPKSTKFISYFARLITNSHDTVLDYFAGSGTTAHAVINLNREDGGKRKYILVEQGEYFDTVLKPRVQKVIYSENWTNGKPQADKDGDLHGVPQIVKVLQLESYEDTLNNLTLVRQDDVFNRLSEAAQEDYLLHYMLTHESRDSLLSTDDFKHPFAYRLNIATSSAGSYESRVIDLVETFNYLLGISVQAVDDQRHDPRRQFVFIEGHLPNGENCLIVWRDCERWDYQQLPELLKKRRINPNNHEFDVIYINGDHNIPTVLQEADGIKTLKLRPIEPEFLSLMFDVEDV